MSESLKLFENTPEQIVINLLNEKGLEDEKTKEALEKFIDQCHLEADARAAADPKNNKLSNRVNIESEIKIAILFSKTDRYKDRAKEILKDILLASSQDQATIDIAQKVEALLNKGIFTPNKFEKVKLRADISAIEIQQEESSIEDSPKVLWVDFDYGEDLEKGIRCPGPNTYVISPVTEQNLFSDKYINCTGVVGIGRDKVSSKEIAFISHQDPEFFVNRGSEEREKFLVDLKATIDELQARSEEATVEVVLFGGNDDPTDATSKKSVDYKKSIDILTATVQNSLGYNPTVLMGPNHDKGAIDVTVLTQERKVSIGR